MKYGETLAERSPPEWQAYNVDYNEIKQLIKERTLRSRSSAIAIPGNSDETNEPFESDLYEELASQHQRVDLFVRSKIGETKRRLDHLEKITLQLQSHPQVAGRSKISVRRLEKFSKLEGEVLRAGDQIQALARYIGAQRLAFVKLLKKYRRWTGSTQLEARFAKNVTSRAKSFENQDLDTLLLQYTELLAAVRAPFEAGLTWNTSEPGPGTYPQPDLPQDSRTADELQRIFESGTNLEADAALAALPFGPDAGHASYWVHPDNLLQLYVLLLQHTRLKVGNRVTSTPKERPTPPITPRESNAYTQARFINHETNGIIVCDELASFAKGRSGITIDQLEAGAGYRVETAAASIRYAPSGECLVLVYPEDDTTGERGCISMPSKFKPKALRPLFRPNEEMNEDTRAERKGGVFLGEDPTRVRSWLQRHPSIQPLVHLQYKRSRFIGLGNTRERGMWATLDGGIQMKTSSTDDFELPSDAEEFKDFPHAILEVRWEGQVAPELVQELHSSHLVERMPGFSLDVHAVAVLCQPEMPLPHWLPVLDRDIRKIPTNPKGSRRRDSPISSEAAGDARPSTATTSTADMPSSSGQSKGPADSSATSVPEKAEIPSILNEKRRARRKPRYPPNEMQQRARYWNEFDNGEEAETEAYTVLVDPNASTPFLDGISALKARGTQTLSKLRGAWFKRGARSDERAPLLPTTDEDYFGLPRASERMDDAAASDTSASPSHRPSLSSRYSAFPTYHSLASPLDPLSMHTVARRDASLAHYAILAFLASLACLVGTGSVQIMWRNGEALVADLAVVCGIVASVACAVAGVGLAAARQEDVGWMSTAHVGLCFAVVCVGNGVLVVHLAGG